MPSLFAALAAQLSSAVDAHMGERLRFCPKGKVDSFGNPIAIDSRQPIIAIGTFIEGDQEVTFMDGDRRISDFNGRVSQHEAWASADKAQFGVAVPRKDDIVETIDRLPAKRMRIVDVLSFSEVRFAFLLVRA